MTTHRKLAAILSADAVGYSRLMADDEAATLLSLNEFRDVFRAHVAAHGGRLIDTAGDSVLAEFVSPVEAVSAATDIQRELADRNAPLAEHRRMLFRIGINLGDVIEQDDGTLYGDGVNVAARLQQLAAPAGLCISGTAFDQVEGKLPLQFKFIGDQHVKNIAKPIRAYRAIANAFGSAPHPRGGSRRRFAISIAVIVAVLVAAGLAWKLLVQPISQRSPVDNRAIALPIGPAIAVLPFTNMGGDPSQEFFADGLAEDILTRLSRFSEIKVIGRNSSFRYKGQSVDVRQVGRELGVGYVLEGSVRKSPDIIRVTVQLLETAKATHIWAESYDLPAKTKDLFAAQDSITNRIASTLADSSGVISRAQFAAVTGRPSETLTSYECLLRARAYNDTWTEATHLPARNCLEVVVKQEPANVEALAWLSQVYIDEYSGPFNPRPSLYDPVQKGLSTAQRAVDIDPTNQQAKLSLAYAHFHAHNIDRFVAEASAAVQLNPNNVRVLGTMGQFLIFAGFDEQGIQLLNRAIWLNPFHPAWYHYAYFHYHYRRKDYEKATAALHKVNQPDFLWTEIFFAAAYSQMQRPDEAKRAVQHLQELKPGFTLATLADESHIWNLPQSMVRQLTEDLRKAGVPGGKR